jgi:ArsR family transcriptional regulator, arsenate/arsenite/antimonite-responsive transcriptional repressor
MKLNDKQAVVALAALAQESRLQVFRLLVRHGTTGLPAGEIAEAIGVPPATLSFHLSQLSQGGLVDSTRTGRSISYFINVDGVRALMAYLMEDCCGGNAESCLPTFDDGACCPPKTTRARKGKKR